MKLITILIALGFLLAGCGGSSERNTAPVAVADSFLYLTDGTLLQVAAQQGVLSNDSDANGDSLEAELVTPPGNHQGEFVLRADGGFTYQRADPAIAGDSFSYRVSDQKSDSAIVVVTLLPNERPVALADSYYLSAIDSHEIAAAAGVLSNDSDAESADIAAQLVTPPDNHDGEFVLQADGGFSYQARDISVLEDRFSYRINDGHANSATVEVVITANHLPQAMDSCRQFTDPQDSISGDLSLLVMDADTEEALAYRITSGTGDNLQLDETSGAFTFTLPSQMKHSRGDKYSFEYEVSDAKGAVAAARVELIYGIPRLLPLGDSLTLGVTSSLSGVNTPIDAEAVGYRKTLFELLQQAGYQFDFVGGFSSGEDAGLTDPEHHGVPGATSTDLLNNLDTVLMNHPADIMLLLIGSNENTFDAGTRAALVENVDALLQRTTEWAQGNDAVEPVVEGNSQDIQFLVATIIPQHASKSDAGQVAFNADLATMLANNWPQAVLVDLFASIDASADMSDLAIDEFGLHPTTAGYEKMARHWFDSLIAADVLNKCAEAAE